MENHIERANNNDYTLNIKPTFEIRFLIDNVIEQRVTNYKRDKAFEELVKGVMEAIPSGTEIFGEEGTGSIVSESIRPDYRRIISWSLMRYLGVHGQFPTNPTKLRPKLIQFIERELGNELKKGFSIDFSQQSHVVEDSLSRVVPSIEEDFLESVKFSSLNDFNNFSEKALKSLNTRKNAGLLFTFMERQIVNKAIKQSFSAVNTFCTGGEAQLLDEYYEAIGECDLFLLQIAECPTKYSIKIEQMIQSLKDAVDTKIKDMKLSDPAQLRISLEPKKYPLHIVGSELKIRIRISNVGTGNAFNCYLSLEGTQEILLHTNNVQLGNLIAEENRVVYIEAKVIAPESLAVLQVIIHWTNFDGRYDYSTIDLEIESQDSEIDWDTLELKQPYSLEVAIGDAFIGRDKLIRKLCATFSRENPGSTYLWGQKRVGKTSVAKAIVAELQKKEQPISVAYLETIRDITAEDTINKMFIRLVEQMQDTPGLAKINPPSPTGTIAPLSEFLEQAISTEPSRNFILILDEFDELPVELYKARGTADAFFQTLGKGIASKQNVGVLLVGGERIPVIIRDQGMRLNMYRPERIDHFDRDKEWDSFVDLVRQPGFPLEFTNNAIELLWEYSAGNPYFLKEIASRLAQMMIERRDAHITEDEVIEGIRRTLDEVEANSFAHYWEDGLIAIDDKDFISQRSERVRFLLTVADTLRTDLDSFKKEQLFEKAINYRCTTQDIERQIRSFQDRGIIVSNRDQCRFRVKLFQDWLKERGYLDLTALVSSELQLAEQLDKQQSEAVSGTEVRELIENWGVYQGRQRTESEVRDWLQQFGGISDQRLLLKLLQNLRFYSNAIIRERFSQAHRTVVRSIVTKIEEGRRSRRDIIVSYLGATGSSGPSMARLYRQENNIYRDNCVKPEDIFECINNNKEIVALVFVDDFIGTGKTATGLIKKLKDKYPELPKIIEERGIKLWYVTVAGTELGIRKVEKELERFVSSARLVSADELGEIDRVFSDDSAIWSSVEERNTAEQIAISFGERLEPRAPLGFGNTQAIVVFEENCPNNSLPILYKTKKGMNFKPLFPRS